MTTMIYLGVTIFCLIFNFIYEQFSYGEHSPYMRYMFILPIIGGVFPFGASILLSQKAKYTLWKNRIAYNLWNCGIATLLNGCLIKGIINISGRFTDYDRIYWMGGGIFLIASLLCGLLCSKKPLRGFIYM